VVVRELIVPKAFVNVLVFNVDIEPVVTLAVVTLATFTIMGAVKVILIPDKVLIRSVYTYWARVFPPV